MAFSAEPQWFVTFSLIGVRDGKRSKVIEFDPAGIDIAAKRAQLDIDIGLWMAAFNETNVRTTVFVSSSWILGYVISEKFVEALPVPSFVGSENVYEEASIQATLAGKNELHSTWIPSPDAQIFAGNSLNTKNIDTADAAYLAYGALFQTGGICLVSDGDTYIAPLNVIDGVLRSVRSGKQY